MTDLTAFQWDIVYVLAGLDEPSGRDIKEALEEYYPSPVQAGHLYPNLDDLADDGYLEKRSRDARTNAYVLTDRGRGALEDRVEWKRSQVTREQTT